MIVLAVLVAAAAAWWIGSPYWTLHQMKSAADQGDSATLTAYIDYPAVRHDLKRQVTRMVRNDLPPEQRGGLGALETIIAGPLIDSLVTPEGLQAALARRGSEHADGKGPRLPGTPDKPVIEHDGLNAFKVHDRNHNQGSLVFHRYGLGWRLVGFELPEEGAAS